MINSIEKIFKFLELNGFEKTKDGAGVYFIRENDYGIDFDKDSLEFTIMGEERDILNIPRTNNPNLIKYIIVGFFSLFPAIGSNPKAWKNQ